MKRQSMMPRRLSYDGFDIAINLLSFLLFFTAMIIFAVRYPHFPLEVPTHYDFSGEPDSWGHRSSTIWLLVLYALVIIPIPLVAHFPRIWSKPNWLDQDKAVPFARLSRRIIEGANLLCHALFFPLIVCLPAMPQWLSIYILVMAIGGSFVLLTVAFLLQGRLRRL